MRNAAACRRRVVKLEERTVSGVQVGEKHGVRNLRAVARNRADRSQIREPPVPTNTVAL